MAKPGLYANIHAKRKRIAAGSGETMRKPGSKGAPTNNAFVQSAKTAKKAQMGGGVPVPIFVPMGKKDNNKTITGFYKEKVDKSGNVNRKNISAKRAERINRRYKNQENSTVEKTPLGTKRTSGNNPKKSVTTPPGYVFPSGGRTEIHRNTRNLKRGGSIKSKSK